MKRARKIQRVVGDVVAIPLGNDRTGFGMLLTSPLVAFFDYCHEGEAMPSVEAIVRARVAFRISVMHQPLETGEWPVIGHVEVPSALLAAPWFFKKDKISGRVTITQTGAEEITPEPGQAETLECAAVWSANHVVDRLRDHFDGKPNKWVESMRLR